MAHWKPWEAVSTSKFFKTILLWLLTVTLLSIITITAHADEVQAGQPVYINETGIIPTTEGLDVLYAIKIPPGHILYSVKLGWETLQETLTVDATKKSLLKQEHLKNRINELKYEVYLNRNKNTAKVLQKIQEKRLEIEEQLEMNRLKYDLEDSLCATCTYNKTDIGKALDYQNKKNIEVLNNLLNNPNMPNASKKGLQNAINNSGMKILTANMAQGNYRVSSSVMSMLPFRTAMIYEPTEKIWYSVIINRDSVSISTNPLSQPDVTLYPTKLQMIDLNNIACEINNNGLSWKVVGRLTKLWYSIPKEEVN